MKRLLIVFLIGLSSVLSYGQESDFRNVKWGMTPSEVRNSETLNFNGEDSGIIFYNGKISGYNVDLVYSFDNNSLKSCYIKYDINHGDDNLYVDDYNTIKWSIKSKYGNPIKETIQWNDKTLKDQPNKIGIAIASGDVIYETNWETDRNVIFLKMDSNKFLIRITITYVSKSYYKSIS